MGNQITPYGRGLALLAITTTLALPAWGAGSTDAGSQIFPVCQTCHTDPVTAQRFVPYKFNPGGLTALFQSIPQMNRFASLDAQTVNDLASYLGVPGRSDTDRLLDWAEDTYPTLLSPTRQPTGQQLGYTYRFYADTGVYVGTKDGSAWIYYSRAPGGAIVELGTMRSFLNLMPNGR